MAQDNDDNGCLWFVVIALIIGGIFLYKDKQQSAHRENDNDGENVDSTVYYEPQKPAQIAVHTTYVEAEVFHFINYYNGSGHIKDANRTITVRITEYSDGTLSCSHGGSVRYSDLPGYEYECNDGNNIFAFNY